MVSSISLCNLVLMQNRCFLIAFCAATAPVKHLYAPPLPLRSQFTRIEHAGQDPRPDLLFLVCSLALLHLPGILAPGKHGVPGLDGLQPLHDDLPPVAFHALCRGVP